MGDKDGGNVQLLLDAADLHLQTLAQLGINGAQRLIQQQNFWPGDDGAGQCHTLLLAAGKLAGQMVAPFFQAQHRQQFFQILFVWLLVVQQHREDDVLLHR